MRKRHPEGPRRRPGRRPPRRGAGGPPGAPRPRGFTEPGLRQLFDLVLPMRGEDRRRFFNQASAGLVAGMAVGGAILGGAWAGPVGAAIGLGVGAAATGALVEKRRFFRR